MKLAAISPLKNNDSEYKTITDNVSAAFKCEWDDEVHESYGRYLKSLKEYSHRVHEICYKAESLVKEAENLNLNEIKSKVDSLCREADTI